MRVIRKIAAVMKFIFDGLNGMRETSLYIRLLHLF
jgi:hypothetical protein